MPTILLILNNHILLNPLAAHALYDNYLDKDTCNLEGGTPLNITCWFAQDLKNISEMSILVPVFHLLNSLCFNNNYLVCTWLVLKIRINIRHLYKTTYRYWESSLVYFLKYYLWMSIHLTLTKSTLQIKHKIDEL